MLGVNWQGMALRKGSMKLLMNVKNITWFKPPELGGVPVDVLLSKGFLKDETNEEILEQLRIYYMVSALIFESFFPHQYLEITN